MNSVTPVFDYSEPPISAKAATNTAANVLAKPAVSKQAPPPPEFKSGQTTLPGSNPQSENLTPEGIKSAVGEIVQNLDRDNAWSNVTNDFKDKLTMQAKIDDEEALKDPVNIAWSISAGAEIAQFATA